MKVFSPYWNERLGVCEKHNLPQIPCPQCLAEGDSDAEVKLTETDLDVLDFEFDISPQDLLPDNFRQARLQKMV